MEQPRHRRRMGRPHREQTPEASVTASANGRQNRSQQEQDEDQDGLLEATPQPSPQLVRMQIRAPGALSAHESKILRRRDKNFASTASRSQSQPREAEKLTRPDAHNLIKHRSLSSPRHKDESSESELTGSSTAPRASSRGRIIDSTSETLSRLEQNLQRFEDERKRFDAEKRLFEREKREHKARHRQMLDHEERKRLLQSYRKLSDRIQLPQDDEERRRLVHSLRLQRHEVPAVRLRNRSSGYDESSTQFSSSDADTAEDVQSRRPTKPTSPARRQASNSSNSNVHYVAAPIRGAPPPPPSTTESSVPPKVPERRSASRNSSLSPIRPQRRSKTPEQRAETALKYVEVGESGTGQLDSAVRQSEAEQRAELMRKYMEAAERAAAAEAALALSLNVGSDGLRRSNSLRTTDQGQKIKPENKRSTSLERPINSKTESNLEPPTELEKAAATAATPQTPIVENDKHVDDEVASTVSESTTKPSALQRIGNLFQLKRNKIAPELVIATGTGTATDELTTALPDRINSIAFLRRLRLEACHEWRRLKLDYPQVVAETRRLRNKCISHIILLILLLGFGGLMFRYTEGTSENIYKCEVRKVKRDFIDNLWAGSHNMREDDWKSVARQKLRKFEDELNTLAELGLRRFPGQKSWNFVNCFIFCWSVITTIGYGHITPKTTLGRSLTIVYAIIGIPMFLIVLADLGKLFTRCVKFIWAYVRRVYYTRSCRRIRKQQQIRDAMTGFTTVYDMAIRRPSMFFGMSANAEVESQQDAEAGKSLGTSHPETPTSPYPETFEVDDEFNLPISVATMLLISYILCGAVGYKLLQSDWEYSDAFYFVFISMSTIGFGDLVPSNPLFVMISMIYLIFGLALTSMFINVVQIKLHDHFNRASAKVGATIGMEMASEFDDEMGSQIKTPSELASVHGSRLDRIDEDGHEPLPNAASPASAQLTSILRSPRPVSPTSVAETGGIQSDGTPPPLLPKRQVSVDAQQPAEAQKKKKKRGLFK
ncbi:uncharacterized protein LOC115624788 isoform X1 [Scaptodrosophila lebanonensis]|uniref:Uncharacterized protein LOC115624788 isoform X1 n=1 Tax=Drosophila lebanonensis TaxID=7225 RepID=A0A6J2TFI1_DROLE|nr:uncharacterized protein LOC115624788 isoform X1 [Scaptodrosophila lebanonensis]